MVQGAYNNKKAKDAAIQIHLKENDWTLFLLQIRIKN